MTLQLPDNTLKSLDFKQFACMLSGLIPGFSGGAIYGLGNNKLLVSDDFTESAEDEARLFLEEQNGCFASGGVSKLRPKTIPNNMLLYCYTLSNHIEEPVGTLILLIKPPKGGDAAFLEKQMAEAIPAIGAIISELYQRTAELNNMANELAVRYEELNLIYETADPADEFLTIRKLLENLVENCFSYMDIAYSSILLLDKKISVNHVCDAGLFEDKAFIDKELNRLYFWTMKSKRSLVLNDENDQEWDTLGIKLPYKILSCPIFDNAENTLGVIVVLKTGNSDDFVNSDRNLLMVMSNKASKILQSNYDTLTGLFSLDAFKYFLSKIRFPVSQLVPESHAILYINMDHLKVINETMSHQAGDEVLLSTGKLIESLIRDEDIAARIGGDIFGVLLYDCPPERALLIAQRISSEIVGKELHWDGKHISTTACIGLSSITSDTEDFLSALDEAEIACNAAKEEGTNKIRFFKFGDIDHSNIKNEMWWANLIQESLNKNTLKLYCQKIQPLSTEDATVRFEILVRAVDDDGSLLPPDLFIPAAERYNLMPSLDRWVINNTLNCLEECWEDLQHKHSAWSINISGQTFRDDTFIDFITDRLLKSKIPSECICFEITETAAVGNLIDAQNFIRSLRALGCKIALDDFGSGLSSFTYLKNLDIDYLKIDGSIVKDIVESNIAWTMVKAIQEVAGALQIPTVGEYVENEAIAEKLSSLQINYAQGNLYGRPGPLEYEIKKIMSVNDTGEAASSP